MFVNYWIEKCTVKHLNRLCQLFTEFLFECKILEHSFHHTHDRLLRIFFGGWGRWIRSCPSLIACSQSHRLRKDYTVLYGRGTALQAGRCLFGTRWCHWNLSGHTTGLESTQLLTEVSTKDISWGKGGRCVRLTTLPPSGTECLEIHKLQPPEA